MPNQSVTTPRPAHSPQQPPPLPLRRSQRIPFSPTYLKDFHCNFLTSSPQLSKGISHPLSSVINYNTLSSSHLHYVLSLSTHEEPKFYHQAVKSQEWVVAMKAEIDALTANNTWTIVDLTSGKHPIGCKWVYKIKYRSDGSVERYKARLVAKGFTQTEGLDYFETFAPVAKLTTVRLLLAVASSQTWFLHQLDVNNAFLHGDLEEEVYMTIPQGVVCSKPNQVCKLHKSLYGLKQASRQWYNKLSTCLLSFGYKHSPHDHSLFTKTANGLFTALLIYVDDLILAGTDIYEINSVKQHLHDSFRIKDLGPLKYFLGLEIARSSTGITVSHRKYALDILSDSGFLASKPVPSPMVKTLKLHNDDNDLCANPGEYRQLVGRLLYLTNTRPDISYAVQQLSQFMAAPTTAHLKAFHRILRYIKGKPGQGLFYPASFPLQLKAFSDSDWAACIDTRKSISGYCIFLGNSLISWRSKK
uniref:Retrovirus-related Pol polyprotein from transposon TNT 1-94 n=1 Tax=Cajanus cajan TaxID=3821 RepID=A0A151SJF9_CAJCA|nr:Retrovirus-related Pol polyprotein from transposon TNT 1-94 [Cajanus cajan]